MALELCSRSPSPLDEDYEDIPAAEEYDDVPEYSMNFSLSQPDLPQTGTASQFQTEFGCCSPQALSKSITDENFNINKDTIENSDPDEPECMQGLIGVKALRDKINKQVTSSPKADSTPKKQSKIPAATREVRSHVQLAAMKATEASAPAAADLQNEDVAQQRFPSPPIRKQFEQLDAASSIDASPDDADEGIGGLQMSAENSVESVEEETPGETASATHVQELQLSENFSEEVVAEDDADGEHDVDTDDYAQFQQVVDAVSSASLEPIVRVFSDDDQDSKALTINDHARANLAAMTVKCTARMPALPPKVQADGDEPQDVYSSEEIQAIAEVLLNPKKKCTSETSRLATPSKINSHMREALRDIHHSPTPRASSMSEKFRQREVGCNKIPTPKAPKGSILGCEPGRSLMPVAGLKAANMAALATINAAMSPHKKNNTQHSRRSKMPNMGLQAANRAAFAEMNSSKTRKLALFQQAVSSADCDTRYCVRAGNTSLNEEDEESNARDRSTLEYSRDMEAPAIVEGLQDSIDGLQASISSEEEVREGDESIYTSFTQELDDDSDDEIFPEETQADHVDYEVRDKVDKIHHTQVSFLYAF